MRSARALGAPTREHLRANLRTRFALAFATVAAVVAATVGLLSYNAAAERIYQEIDASLQSAATAACCGASVSCRRTPATAWGVSRRHDRRHGSDDRIAAALGPLTAIKAGAIKGRPPRRGVTSARSAGWSSSVSRSTMQRCRR